MLSLDKNFNITDANPAAKSLLPKNLLGRPMKEIVVDFTGSIDLEHLAANVDIAHALSVSTASGNPETYDFRFYPVEQGWLAFGGLDLNAESKLRNEVLQLNRELGNTTRALHVANRDLRTVNDLKDLFLGMAAHDLRNPLGVLLAYNQMVFEEAELNEEHQRYLGTCLRVAEQMRDLINNFLDLAVIQSGHLRLSRHATPARAMVDEVMEMCRLKAKRKDVCLIVEEVSDNLALYADESKWKQVLLNLVLNAIEHSKSGQSVWISARQSGEEAVFSVRDEGAGIAPDEQKNLFNAFSGGGNGKTAGERSTGLGLTIARRIVEAHQGRIWLGSEPNAGATFLFSTPLADSVPSCS
jgi:signal transduction histidine kinase